jgi:hypothetical protein
MTEKERDYIREYMKEYRKRKGNEHRSKQKEYNRVYIKRLKEKDLDGFKKRSNDYMKQYRLKNKKPSTRTKKTKEEVLETRRKYWENNKERIKQYNREWYKENHVRLSDKKKKHREENLELYTNRDKEYYTKNTQLILEKHKKYYTKNRHKIKEYKESIKERTNEYCRNRRKVDVLFRLRHVMNSRISSGLKRINSYKTNKTVNIIGISFQGLREYLESQFEPWMNWNNYGKYKKDTFNYGWDIDHIIPTSTATTEEEVLKLCYYTNLKPLCSKINRDIKKNKV